MAFLAAACSPAAVTTTTVEAPTPTAAPTTTTTAPETTTTTASTTTTTSPAIVGDPAALQALFDEIEGFVTQTHPTYDGSLEPPDLNTPDPVEAVTNALRFNVESGFVQAYPDWPNVYTLEDSPAREYFVEIDTFFWVRDLVIGELGAPFEITDGTEIPLEEASPSTPVDEWGDLSSIDGVRAVRLHESMGPYNAVSLENGEVVQTFDPIDEDKLVLVAPSDVGWQLVWYGE